MYQIDMKLTLAGSVGYKAENMVSDVNKVQELLDANLHLLIPYDCLGIVDTNEQTDIAALISRIKTFQRRVLPLFVADGRVDPGGKTLKSLILNAMNAIKKGLSGKAKIPLFPILDHSLCGDDLIIKNKSCNFGSGRCGDRLHAGIDLKYDQGTKIRAMEDGEIIQRPMPFYEGLNALVIDHKGFIARYCEIDSVNILNFEKVKTVKRGQIIARVGKLHSGNSMLHLELYSGVCSGPLTDHSQRPFYRRNDLLNPVEFIKASVLRDTPSMEEPNAQVNSLVTDKLNIRISPNFNLKPIGKLLPGDTLFVKKEIIGDEYVTDTGPSNRWYEIDLDKNTGYCAAYYIEIRSFPSTGLHQSFPNITSFNALGNYGKVSYRVKSKLNLRSQPDTNGKILDVLEIGLLLSIKQKLNGGKYTANCDQYEDWLQVEFNCGDSKMKSGYVAAFFVDPVLRKGRPISTIKTKLIMRSECDINSVEITSLTQYSRFAIKMVKTGGIYKDPSGKERNDWYEIEFDSKRGYVACDYVELLDPEPDKNDLNEILYTYEPSGASDKTALQDELPGKGIHGVKASEAMACSDNARVKT